MKSTRLVPIRRSERKRGSAKGWAAVSRLILPSLLVGWLGLGPAAEGALAPAEADSVEARIDVERTDRQLRIRGQLVNRGGATGAVHYELVVRRRGAGGTARMVQSGRVETVPGQTDTLSTVRVSARAGDRLQCRLNVRADGRTVGAVRRAWTVSTDAERER